MKSFVMARLVKTGLEDHVMNTTYSRICCLVSGGFVACLVLVGGCSSSAVGDPCTPEQVPAGGFDSSDIFLETASVQCATRTCIVYELDGDPNDVCGEPDATATCVDPQEVKDRVHCTCRCKAPAGSSLPTCACPTGFSCVEALQTGNEGVAGDYCVDDNAI